METTQKDLIDGFCGLWRFKLLVSVCVLQLSEVITKLQKRLLYKREKIPSGNLSHYARWPLDINLIKINLIENNFHDFFINFNEIA